MIFIDFETQSAADLKAVGGRRYAKHSTTRVLCLGVSWGSNAQYRVWVPDEIGFSLPAHLADGTAVLRGEGLPDEIAQAVEEDGVVVAHNANSFDRYVWDRFVRIPVHQWVDTVYMARQAGYPGKLDLLGERFTGRGKDEGSAVLKKCMTLEWSDKHHAFTNRFLGSGSVSAIARYCVRDVELLRMVHARLRSLPIPDAERRVVELDGRINRRGVAFDEGLAASVGSISAAVVAGAGRDIERLTSGALKVGDLRSIPKMTTWLQAHGVKLKNLRRQTVEEFLYDPIAFVTGQEDDATIPDFVLDVLRLRNCALRITGAKLERASAMCDEGRLHDLLVYHQAHTGRWSSRGVQVHNLPRGNDRLDLPRLCAEPTLANVTAEAERLHISADDVLSAMVRPCLAAKKDHLLVVSDFNAIENRVLGWCAEDEAILAGFERGQDPYKLMAMDLYGVAYEEVTKEQRTAAKPVVLGGGYQLSAGKLAAYAKGMRIDLSVTGLSPEFIVEKFRSKYPAVCGYYEGDWEGHPIRRRGLWRDLQQAWVDVVTGVKTFSDVGRCRLWMYDHCLAIKLPSGRNIMYPHARVEDRVPTWGGDPRPTCVFTSSRGEQSTYGGKLAENCLTADTKVLTREGVCRLIDVRSGDKVWDGEAWVTTSGCISRGERRVGEWLGIRITEDHLITDGDTWIPVIALGDSATRRCLKWAARTVDCEWSEFTSPTGLSHSGATVGRSPSGVYADFNGGTSVNADIVIDEESARTPTSSPIREFDRCGTTGIHGCWLDTGKVEPVYDLLNCGPRNRFTVITESGPVVVHNCVQAIARDLLAEALLVVEERYPVVLHVHDEIVCEVPTRDAEAACAWIEEVMSKPPAWAPGLPMAAEAFSTPRYSKSKWVSP